MIAVLIGMVLVYRFFPKKEQENELRDAYHAAGLRGGRRGPGRPTGSGPRRGTRGRGRRAGTHPAARGREMTVLHTVLADTGTVTFFKGWDFTGNFTFVDLIAASTNALNGALLCRRPDHYKLYTIVGVLMMALLGGLGGGITPRRAARRRAVGTHEPRLHHAGARASGRSATSWPTRRGSSSARACSSS